MVKVPQPINLTSPQLLQFSSKTRFIHRIREVYYLTPKLCHHRLVFTALTLSLPRVHAKFKTEEKILNFILYNCQKLESTTVSIAFI